MKFRIHNIALFLLVIGMYTLTSESPAQELTSEDISKVRVLAEAIEESEKLLAKYPDRDFTPNLMFQLGELYVRRAHTGYQRAMMRYEDAEQRYARGLQDYEPTIPEIDFEDALRIFYDLLNKYPNAAFRDKLLYRIALCHLEQGEKPEAMKHFHDLTTNTDKKQLYEEANFRLGEFYFEQKDIDTAIEHYSKLLDSWDSPYFGMALYKLGWCYYQVDNFAKAISTFIYLIEDVNLTNQVQSDAIGKSQADLRQEATEYVAICFAEYGGADKAREFLTNKRDLPYVEKVLLQLAELYRQRNYYEDAIAALHVLLDFYPDKPSAPIYQKKIVENYEMADKKPKADQARIELIAKYGPGSEWLSRISEGESRDEILAIVEELQYTLGTEAQAQAQQSGDSFDYNLAIQHYEDYLAKFPNTERSAKVQFYLAECFYELGEFTEAAKAYHNVTLRYPGSEFVQTAAYNRILAYNHLLQSSPQIDSTDYFLFNFLGDSESGVNIIQTRNSEEAQLLQTSNDFYVFHRSSPRIGEVLMNYAGLLYGLEELQMAKRAYEKVITDSTAERFHAQAYMKMAQAELKQENFLDAEDWCKKLIADFPDSTDQVDIAKTMMASARFKYAESFAARGDSLQAAQEFETVAATASDTSIASRALFTAAVKYEELGDKSKALTLLESFPQRFPTTELTEQALLKAGLLCEESAQWQRAADNYLRLYDLSDHEASKSLFFAARCYENLEQWEQARSYYDTYVGHHTEDADRHLEAAFRKGEIAYEQEQFQTAEEDFEYVLSAHEKFAGNGGAVQNYIPAQAQFLIAEMLFHSFDGVKITPPLNSSLKKKRNAFEKVVKAYTRAAKYKVAEWTTASSHKIGFAFERFAYSLLESPRPANLTGEALKQYNAKLRKSVQPFMEKALDAYRANVRQATENGIENQWVDESRKRMEVLMTELDRGTASTSGS